MACRILVVEDDIEIRSAVSDALSEEGYAVSTASDGAEGLDFLRRESQSRTQLVLLDMMMPRVSGWDFLQAKHADPAISPIPVLIVSASRDSAATKLDTVVGELPKPFHLADLLAKVKEHCPTDVA